MIRILEQHERDLTHIKKYLDKVNVEKLDLADVGTLYFAIGLIEEKLKRIDKEIEKEEESLEEMGKSFHDHVVEYDKHNLPYCVECGEKLGVAV